jgi:hypothetical protein
MRRHGRVSDEGRFLACIEKSQPDIVIHSVRGEHEGHFGVRELARDAKQGGLVESVRVEDNHRRIARETGRGKGVYLKNAQPGLRSLTLSFARIRPAGYTSMNLGVACNGLRRGTSNTR